MTTPDPARITGPLVVMPTFNEVENLARIAERLRDAVPDAHLLVVDDNSPDGTGRVADELAARHPRVHVLHRDRKAGLGAAYLAGFAWGLAHGAEVLVEMDADGSHAPEELPRLLAALQSADLVLGSRWMPGGQVVDWPRWREALSRSANVYARHMLRLPVSDSTGGYRVYRRATLEAIDFTDVASRGYCFQIDLVRRVLQAGLRVVEVPIRFVERTAGTSKMSRAVVGEALWRVTAWGLRERLSGRSAQADTTERR